MCGGFLSGLPFQYRTDFLKSKGEGAKGALAAAENVASMAIADKTGKMPSDGAVASSGTKMAGGKKAAEDGFKSSVGIAADGEEKAGGLYNNGRYKKE